MVSIVPWYSATAASEIPEAGSQASQRLPCLGVPRSERQRPLQKGRGFEGPTALGKIEAKLTERWRAGTRIEMIDLCLQLPKGRGRPLGPKPKVD